MTSNKYRETVARVKKGDLIVHYKKPYVIAISKAKENGKHHPSLPQVVYGSGWEFKTDYFVFEKGIHRSLFAEEVAKRSRKDYAVNPDSHVKQGYFMEFDKEGLEIILSHTTDLPDWAKQL